MVADALTCVGSGLCALHSVTQRILFLVLASPSPLWVIPEESPPNFPLVAYFEGIGSLKAMTIYGEEW